MSRFTAVLFFLDDHSTRVIHYEAEHPDDWPTPADGVAYLVGAVFDGWVTPVYSEKARGVL